MLSDLTRGPELGAADSDADLVRFRHAQRLEGDSLNFANRQQSKPRPHHVRITGRQTEIRKPA